MFGTVGNYFLLTWVNVSHSLKGIWLLSHWVRVHTQAPPTPAPHWRVQPKPTFEMWKMIQFSVITKQKKWWKISNSQVRSTYFHSSSSESFVPSQLASQRGGKLGAESKQEVGAVALSHRANAAISLIHLHKCRTGVVQYWHVAWCLPCSWPAARRSVADQ